VRPEHAQARGEKRCGPGDPKIGLKKKGNTFLGTNPFQQETQWMGAGDGKRSEEKTGLEMPTIVRVTVS